MPMTISERDVQTSPSYIECEVCDRRMFDDLDSPLRLEFRAHQAGWEKHEGTVRCEYCKVRYHLFINNITDAYGEIKK